MLPQRLNLGNPVNRSHPFNRGQLAWWMVLRDWAGGGTWRDLAGLYPGALTSMGSTAGWRSTLRPGGFGEMHFDSIGFVTISASTSVLALTSPFRISFWVKTTVSTTVISHINNSSFTGFEVGISQGGGVNKPSLWNGSGWTSANTAVDDGAWHFVGIQNDGANTSYDLDGAADGTVAQGSPNTPSGGLYIGSRNGGTNMGVCSLDSVRIWPRTFTAGEKKSYYDQSRRGYPDALNWVRTPALLAQQAAAAGGVQQRLMLMGVGARTAMRNGITNYRRTRRRHPLYQPFGDHRYEI